MSTPGSARVRVLVVDDEPPLRQALTISLRARGYAVAAVATGEEALRHASDTPPDLVVLDLGLPDLEGAEVLRRLRGWTRVPVLVLSGRSDSLDKVEALDAGADDYVTKPFGMDELLARLRALARRAPAAEEPVVALGDAEVDLAARRVVRAGEEVRLTPTEWHLLEELVRHPGRLRSQRDLLLEVWGPGYEDAHANLRLYMAQLRRKLETDPRRPRHLVTEAGMGYRFEP